MPKVRDLVQTSFYMVTDRGDTPSHQLYTVDDVSGIRAIVLDARSPMWARTLPIHPARKTNSVPARRARRVLHPRALGRRARLLAELPLIGLALAGVVLVKLIVVACDVHILVVFALLGFVPIVFAPVTLTYQSTSHSPVSHPPASCSLSAGSRSVLAACRRKRVARVHPAHALRACPRRATVRQACVWSPSTRRVLLSTRITRQVIMFVGRHIE
ncbi:uncharacterized protein B0H18DRAFT_359323 [Fomitopsis serialis]|uniref:uncharacterized protein n=1 Tax=Fomitopsis serialis TaxID=139415 RepID=UPI0020086400|nr:uncharacterized protein B0H18DRAFT_359323 [Neoantrodia serialis]KAH9925988.1 hypothetical protein B0H18DRAFT_359323 [Neoantrodia serialis]